MNILILGGTGAMGTYLQRLLDDGQNKSLSPVESSMSQREQTFYMSREMQKSWIS